MRQKGFPGNALGIEYSALFGFGVAAGCCAFLDHRRRGVFQASVKFVEFVVVPDLDTEVADIFACAARGPEVRLLVGGRCQCGCF